MELKGHSAVALILYNVWEVDEYTDSHVVKCLAIECAKGRGLILPGGKFEKDVDINYQECARRELLEETGVVATDPGKIFWSGIDRSGYYCHGVYFQDYDDSQMQITSEGKPVFISFEDLLKNKFFGPDYYVMYQIIIERGYV